MPTVHELVRTPSEQSTAILGQEDVIEEEQPFAPAQEEEKQPELDNSRKIIVKIDL